MRRVKPVALFWVLLAVGFLCCVFSLLRRASAEGADRAVAFSIRYSDALALAEASGQSAGDWLRALAEAGAAYLIGTDETEAEARAAASAAGMAFARAGDTARSGDAFLLPPVDGNGALAADTAPQGDGSVPLALVENPARTGVRMPEDFDPDAWDGPMVKTLFLYEPYAAGDTEGIVFRAVTERGARLVVLTPLANPDPAAYAELLERVSPRLSARGYVLVGAFSCPAAPRLDRPLLAGMALLPAALLTLLICMLLPADPRRQTLILLAGALAALGGALFAPRLLQTLAAFGTAVLAACWSALWLAFVAGGSGGGRLDSGPPPLRYLTAFAGLLLPALAGGLCVGALLADRAYLLQFRVFRGVKLAQLLPLALAAAALWYVLLRRAVAPRGKLRPAQIVLTLCAAAALGLALLRSGDNAALTGSLELRVRDWLERALYARPRTKEVLLAWPALALFLAARERSAPLPALLFGLLAEVGAVSVVNTFCHLFTPLRVSLARTLLGAVAGALLGLALSALCAVLLRRPRRKTRGEP